MFKPFNSFFEKLKNFGFRKLYFLVQRIITNIHDALLDSNIIRSKKSQSIIKTRLGRKLLNVFSGDEGHNINRYQHFLGYGLIHYSIIRNIKPKKVLCIGSRKGFIPAIFALACRDNNYGSVDFVDAAYDKKHPHKHWSGIGFWKKVDPRKHFSQIGVSKFISTYIMTSEKFANRHPNRRYQYIYIDGDHSYYGVKKDYKLFWKKLDNNGFLVFHDIIVKGYIDKGKFGVWKLWKELKQTQKIQFHFPKQSGLGIIQKI